MSRLPEELCSRDPLAFSVRVGGVEGIKDSTKNRDRVAARLGKPGLEVIVTNCPEDGSLVATFSYGGKPVKLAKKKDDVNEKKVDHNDVSDISKLALEGEAKKVLDETVKCPSMNINTGTETTKDDLTVKESEIAPTKKEAMMECSTEVSARNADLETENTDSSKTMTSDAAKTQIVTFQELPPLSLSEGESVSGMVTYISTSGGVWFSPGWLQEKLFQLDEVIHSLKDELKPRLGVEEGELCLARAGDGCIYRARVASVTNSPDNEKIISVEFIDFGNIETVSEVFEYPDSVSKEIPPAAIEVRLAQSVSRDVLEMCLGIGDKDLELHLETDQTTGQRIATFYQDKREILFQTAQEDINQNLASGDVIVNSEALHDDVVVESEAPQSNISNKQVIKEGVEIKTDNCTDEAVYDDKMFKLVECPPMGCGKVTVVVVLVESVSKVWVTRKETEAKVLKMMFALERMDREDGLDMVSNVTVGCVYGARFTQDGLVYRALVDQVDGSKVWVRYIDYGNTEINQIHQMFHLPERMARLPPAAVMVEIEENTEVEDSQINRDKLEMELEGELDMEFVNNRLTRILVAGQTVHFHFNNTQKIGQASEESVNKDFKHVDEDSGTTKPSKDEKLDKVEKKITKLEVGTADKKNLEDSENNKMTRSNSLDSGSFTNMQDVITSNVINDNCLVEKKSEQVEGDVVLGGQTVAGTEIPRQIHSEQSPCIPPPLRKPNVIEVKHKTNEDASTNTASTKKVSGPGTSQVPRQIHSDHSPYIPPPLRNNDRKTGVRKPNVNEVKHKSTKDTSTNIVSTKNVNGPEVSSVAELKLMLERELPIAREMLDRPKGDGEENRTSPVLDSCGTSKVDDWLARNEASQRMEGLENPVYEPIGSVNTREREIAVTKDDCGEKLTVRAAQADLAKLLERASPSSLMMNRESSLALQRLIPMLPQHSLQPLVQGVVEHFNTLSTNR